MTIGVQIYQMQDNLNCSKIRKLAGFVYESFRIDTNQIFWKKKNLYRKPFPKYFQNLCDP